jgi:hypothetical protein
MSVLGIKSSANLDQIGEKIHCEQKFSFGCLSMIFRRVGSIVNNVGRNCCSLSGIRQILKQLLSYV